MNESQLAVDNFNFFYNKLVESTCGFEWNRSRTEKERQAYNNIKVLFSRLIIEYHGVAFAHGGEIPQELAPKLEQVCSIGELISRHEYIIEFQNKNKNEEE